MKHWPPGLSTVEREGLLVHLKWEMRRVWKKPCLGDLLAAEREGLLVHLLWETRRVNEALASWFVDCGERGALVHLLWETRVWMKHWPPGLLTVEREGPLVHLLWKIHVRRVWKKHWPAALLIAERNLTIYWLLLCSKSRSRAYLHSRGGAGLKNAIFAIMKWWWWRNVPYNAHVRLSRNAGYKWFGDQMLTLSSGLSHRCVHMTIIGIES